jgi:hypothetical protein
MRKNKNKPLLLVIALILLVFVLLACSSSGGEDEISAEELAQAIALTITANAVESGESVDTVGTAQAEATLQSQSSAATMTAAASLNEEQKAGTATAFAPFLPELEIYGVDPNRGRPAWIHPPIRLELEGYQQNDSANQYIGTVAKDFVLSADITWNTEYGTSGCGYVLRSDGNEETPSQYMLIATRGGAGHVIFATMANGEFVDQQDFYATGIDPSFGFQNDQTNRIAVVARGMDFEIWSNGTKLGDLKVGEPPSQPVFPPPPQMPSDTSDSAAMEEYQKEKERHEEEVEQIQQAFRSQQQNNEEYNTAYERGFVTMIAISESGRTICEFDNAWLWLMED